MLHTCTANNAVGTYYLIQFITVNSAHCPQCKQAQRSACQCKRKRSTIQNETMTSTKFDCSARARDSEVFRAYHCRAHVLSTESITDGSSGEKLQIYYLKSQSSQPHKILQSRLMQLPCVQQGKLRTANPSNKRLSQRTKRKQLGCGDSVFITVLHT